MSVMIHGTEYRTVSERVNEFREKHPDWTIQNTLISIDDKEIVMKTEIFNETGRLIASGHAHEKRNASKILTTSALEVAETSSVGRALAFFGLAGSEIASANEVQAAVKQQNLPSHDKYADEEAALQSCGTEAELLATWKRVYEKVKHDSNGLKHLTSVKDKAKAGIT